MSENYIESADGLVVENIAHLTSKLRWLDGHEAEASVLIANIAKLRASMNPTIIQTKE